MQLRSPLGRAAWAGLSVLGLVSCGGGDSANAPPEAVIVSPADGVTYQAGDTLVVELRASDPQDGPLPPARMSWWVDFHHDTHTHPLVLPTAGAGGRVNVLTRGETSDNVWIRVHLRATDSAGVSTEVSRDIQPRKAPFTLASQPSGLELTLDGQPVAAPHTVTGVVGIERDIGAADQVFNGRRYRFSNWSHGGAGLHTIATPATATTFTAVFIDAGEAVNAPPAVAITAPANNSTGNPGTPITLSATASDSDGTVASVQFFDGATAVGAPDTTAPYSVRWTPATTGVYRLTARATDDRGAITTSAPVSVTINVSTSDTQPPTVSIVEPAPFADGLTGVVALRADATDNVGVQQVEFQIDGVPLVTDSSAPYVASVDTSLHAAGQHVLRVRARDSAGNQSEWSSLLVRFAGTREAPAGITRTPSWLRGIRSASAIAEAPDGRLFIAEQEGAVRVVLPDGTLVTAPLLRVVADYTNERGVLGVAVHPQFDSNGYIYIYYTTPQGGAHNRISRFTVSGNTAANETVLADLPTLTSGIHNGGAMHFGADGKLYVAVGDNQRGATAQDPSSPFGKLLRFNDDGSIPDDNPYCNTQGNLACAAWAHGLRNPFTFAVQPGTGRIHINDVGQGDWEEINLGARGANYGWPATEGPTTNSGVTAPIVVYPHDRSAPLTAGDGPGGFIVGACIIGGGFYPEQGPFPAPWRGGYFFTDFIAGFVAFVDVNNGNAVYSFGSVPEQPTGMIVTRKGELLVLHRSSITRFAAE
ncbi:MAG: PQQ-dependent sugar dehydrogenase [Burkholderiaceae bacterium]|nr:PQQ-dependent sugar dehydrogenase [Burkholderiaceae bacterium]